MANKNRSAERRGTEFLLGAGFFLAVCLASCGTAKGTALVCAVLAAAAGAAGFSRLRGRFRLPMLALTLVVALDGLSMLHAPSGKFALEEFLKPLTALCLCVLLLAQIRGDDRQAGRRIAAVLETAAALLALVSIDLISTRVLSGAVTAVLGLFSADYDALAGLEAGVRMTSLLDTPNVFAGCMGIGVLLSLGLVLSSQDARERRVHTVCLYLTALAFVLAFSMGAAAFIVLAFLAYLALEQRERRAALFVLMAETLPVTLAGAALTAPALSAAWDGVRPVPLLCAVGGSAALCLLDHWAGRRLTPVLAARARVVPALIAGVLAVLLAVGLLACCWTGPAELDAGETLRRSVYPEPGAYTLKLEGEGTVQARITSQNRQETMMHTETVLYTGPAQGAAFTVPEDSLVVWLELSADNGAALEQAVCQGAEPVTAPLGYRLLPGFIANRMQGLFANQNAIQRTVFFEDGMKLFARGPVLGLGLGSYENGIKSVQSFFYETKYAHNHYIQTLLETGVVGLALFLGLLGASAGAVLRDRRREAAHPLTPALGAALVFIAGHAAVEVDLSFYAFLPFAFGVFALSSLCCGTALEPKWLTGRVRSRVLLGAAVLTAVFSVLLIGNLSAARLARAQLSFEALEQAARIDVFDRNDYKLSYVTNSALVPEDSQVQQKARAYAEELAEANSNSIPIYLAEYYLSRGETEQGFAMAEKYVDYVSSDANAWNVCFTLLSWYDDGSDLYRDGVARLTDRLAEWTAEHMGSIALDPTVTAYLDALGLTPAEG